MAPSTCDTALGGTKFLDHFFFKRIRELVRRTQRSRLTFFVQ